MQEQTFIEKQAYDWLVKIETGNMANDDEDRFVDWLSQDEMHGEAFYQAEKTWQLMHQVTEQDITTEELPSPNQTQRFSRTFMPIAACLIVGFFTVFWGQSVLDATFSDYYTSTGKSQVVTLEDGTIVTLNTDSAIDIQFTDKQRLVILKSGEIYVDVAKDVSRAFIVDAGLLKVTALGTEFIVDIHEDAKPSVTVTEHSVKLENNRDLTQSIVVESGQKAYINSVRNVIAVNDDINTTHETSWLSGKFIFTDKTLAQVIEEVERYHRGKIVIRDDALKQQKLSGVLDLKKPIVSLQGLTDILPIKVTSITPYLIVIEKA